MLTTDRTQFVKLARETYTRLPYNRNYALSDEQAMLLGAFAAAWREHPDHSLYGEGSPNLGEALTELGKNVPTLFQQRPSDPPPTPKPWCDPVTGIPLPNPFAKGSEDLRAQTILTQRDPALAAHYKAMADDPYGTLAKMQDEEARRERLKTIKYDSEIHTKMNPWVSGNRKQQDDLTKLSPELAAYYKQESVPVSLPFGPGANMTERGRVWKNPKLRAIADRADEIAKQWIAQERERLLAARAEAEARLKELVA
jgi:hypothetical protein